VLVNPIKYVSRTFQTILNDINSVPDLADKPDWFKRLIAGVGDVISMICNAASNNAYLRTAFTRQAVVDLCALIDYVLPPATTSQGMMLFYFPKDVVFPFSVSAGDLVANTKGSIVVASRRFGSKVSTLFNETKYYTNLSTNPISVNQIYSTNVFVVGEKVMFSSSGTIPTGISNSIEYFTIPIDSTHFKIALSINDAFAGVSVVISGGIGNLETKVLSGKVLCHQIEIKNGLNIGVSDGSTSWQEFSLPDINVLEETLVVKINNLIWNKVSSLTPCEYSDKCYVLIYNTDGSSFIRFGNGVYGEIPANFDIFVDYGVGGGVESNISMLNSINSYAGGDNNINGCTNITTFTGGTDAQSIETAKIVAPGTLKSRDRFVTAEDGETLTMLYGGVSLVSIISNFYGTLSAKVITIAIGGGNPNSTFKSELQAYLISKSILQSIDVRIADTTITPMNVSSSAKMLQGYLWADILPYFRLAWKLFLAETGQEIINVYKSDGISGAVVRINTLFSETFTSPSYTIIENLILGLETLGARTFGESIQSSDAITFIQGYVPGIDYMTITLPTFPITLVEDGITTYGTLTLVQL